MIGEGTKKIDLYDLFSVLIPGIIFLILLYPLLPDSIEISGVELTLIILIGGFVAGRAIHATRIELDKRYGESHREYFIKAVKDQNEEVSELSEEFWSVCDQEFPKLISRTQTVNQDEQDLNSNGQESEENHDPISQQDIKDTHIEELYTLVRSAIYMDARGRSRSFQALFDFYGSMWITFVLIFVIYAIYAIGNMGLTFVQDMFHVFGVDSAEEVIGYNTHLSNFDIHPGMLFFGSALLFLGVGHLFRVTRRKYRHFYVTYLMSDFIILAEIENEKST